ncbi:MAG: hypothetical protein JWP66_1888 [Naasia sp.]|nr:hypothetical protein [Naasia sp.]
MNSFLSSRITHSRARLYDIVRTAHLERAHRFAPAAILYTNRRYDFDEQLTHGLELLRADPIDAARLLASSPVRELEVNEPLMLHSTRRTAVVLAVLRLRRLLTGKRITVVTYAIENRSPWSDPSDHRGARGRIRAVRDRALSRYVWKRIDRVVYGTDSARDLYRSLFPAVERPEVVIPALPAPAVAEAPVKDPDRVAFVGAFTERKGFDLLLAAWPHVVAARPGTRLSLVGKGRLEADARVAESEDASIDLLLDPPRAELFRTVAAAQVVVLPSQPTPRWREQVGLPIVEGLSYGCSIVTTTETGLARWLAEHGHGVIRPRSAPEELAAAILDQLATARPAIEVLATLPAVDGREAADDWLFAVDRSAATEHAGAAR